MKVKVKSLSPIRLFCKPMDGSLLGFRIHGIFQARILEWVAISFSNGSFKDLLIREGRRLRDKGGTTKTAKPWGSVLLLSPGIRLTASLSSSEELSSVQSLTRI